MLLRDFNYQNNGISLLKNQQSITTFCKYASKVIYGKILKDWSLVFVLKKSYLPQ